MDALNPQQPIVPPSAPSSLPTAGMDPIPQRSPGRTLAVLGIVLVLLLGIGGIGLAAVKGWISLPFFQKQPTLEDAVEKLASLTSARVAMDGRIALQPKAEGTPVVTFRRDASEEDASMAEPGMMGRVMDGALMSLPSDTILTLKLSSDWSRGKDLAEYAAMFDGTYSAGSLSIGIAAEVRKVGEYTYVQPTKLPSFIVDFSPIVGQWIRIAELSSKALSGDASVIKSEYVSSEDDAPEEPEEKGENALTSPFEEFALVFEKGSANGAFMVATVDDKAMVEGQPAWKMTLAFDPERYREAFRSAHAERETRIPDVDEYVLLTDEALAALDDKIAQERADALTSAMTFDLFVDKKTHIPSMISVHGTFVVDSDEAPTLQDRQVELSSSVTLTHPNEPIAVEAPSEWMSIMEAGAAISGVSKAEVRHEQQTGAVNDIRDALSAYHEEKGSYPAQLSDLVGFTWWPYGAPSDETADEEIEGMIFATSSGSYRSTVVAMPNDLYTDKPFPYSVTPEGYRLSYEIRLSGVQDGDEYLEGTNTATQDALSVEAADPVIRAARELQHMAELKSGPDTDGDGMSDKWEDEVGTDPNDGDTDGDGYGDLQEVEGGYNALGTPTSALGIARMRSRDSKRVADIKQIQTALELYYADASGYPLSAPVTLGSGDAGKLCESGFMNAADSCLFTTYMGMIPSAPTPIDGDCSKTNNEYRYSSVVSDDYTLTFCIGGEVGDIVPGPHMATPNGIE